MVIGKKLKDFLIDWASRTFSIETILEKKNIKVSLSIKFMEKDFEKKIY